MRFCKAHLFAVSSYSKVKTASAYTGGQVVQPFAAVIVKRPLILPPAGCGKDEHSYKP